MQKVENSNNSNPMQGIDDVIREATIEYLKPFTAKNHPSPKVLRAELLGHVNAHIDLHNLLALPGYKVSPLKKLTNMQIVNVILRTEYVINIDYTGTLDESADTNAVAIYDPKSGLYSTSKKTFYNVVSKYRYDLKENDFREIVKHLGNQAPVKSLCSDRDIIIVNNGIFNYATKQLQPFSPKYVFTSKSGVNYNPLATNVVIYNPDDGTDWDVESWMQSLSDDSDVVDLLWQVAGAVVRPYNAWDKAVILYSPYGSNGKGTFIELLRQLCGNGSWVSIPIADFSKEFYLEPLLSVNAVLVDENDTNSYLDKAANFKAAVTGDSIYINRKFLPPVSYKSKIFMVQCMNSTIRVKDKSDSFYRRLLPIPMEKRFFGHERKYIKHDYLKRKEVLEYVLYKVLHTNYYELSVPKVCEDLLGVYKSDNDYIRQFTEYFFEEDVFQWDLLPFEFLYDLYKSWFKKNNPSGIIEGSKVFKDSLIKYVNEGNYDFIFEGKNHQYRPSNRMDKPEFLIAQYDLDKWKSETYNGPDLSKVCLPRLAHHYRGFIRK